MKRILIAGIGNVLLGDDGIGPFVVRMLESQYAFGGNVELRDLGTPGLDLPIYLSGAAAVILIDAAQFGGEPGSIRLFRRNDVLREPVPVRVDPHSPALRESLVIADLMDDAAPEFLLIGIQGRCFGPASGIAAPVRQAAPRAIDAVIGELRRLRVPYRRKCNAEWRPLWWDLPRDNYKGVLCVSSATE